MNKLLKLLNKYRVLKVRFLIIFLILIYIPMALYMNFVYTKTIDAVEMEKIGDIEQIFSQTEQSVNYALNDIEKGIFEISENLGIRIGVESFDELMENQKESISEYIKKQFSNFRNDVPYIDKFVCIDKSGRIISSDDNIIVDSDEFYKSKLHKKLLYSNYEILWNYDTFDYISLRSPNRELFLLACKIRDSDDLKETGYFLVTIDSEKFKDLYKNTNIGNTGEIVIYDANNNPILSSRNYNIPEDILHSLVKEENFYKMNNICISERQYLLGSTPLFPTEWFLVAVVPRSELTKTVKNNLRSNFVPIISISIITALLIIIETLILSKAVTDRELADYRLIISEKMNEKLRIYKHDFTNHLQIIWGLMELKHYDEALDYLAKTSNEGIRIKEKYEIGIPEIESTIFSILSRAREESIEVELDCIKLESNLPVKVYDLTKILSNLLKNALYALKNTESDSKKLKIKIYKELGEYVFEVINNVPLIPEKMRKKIFEKGFTTKGREGSGLGLHIVKKLTERNKGTVELKVDGEGNHFLVRFPC